MKIKDLLILALTLIGSLALAHGEDKRGPHGGFIRMPGAFHTELVHEGGNKFRVYLLDINWTNPVVQNSNVSLELRNQIHSMTARCEVTEDFFRCTFPKELDGNAGTLFLDAVRSGQLGNQVAHSLPLTLNKRR